MKRQRGFTIIELMTVLAIIAVLAALVIGATGRTYGVNATTMSEQLVQTFTFARNRALATRKIHRVEIHFETDPMEIRIWQARKSGMSRASITDTDVGETPLFVQRTIIPKSVTLFAAETGVKPARPASGSLPTNASQRATQFDIDFLHNGGADVALGSTNNEAATIYVTDPGGTRETRVHVYSATGSSYARTNW